MKNRTRGNVFSDTWRFSRVSIRRTRSNIVRSFVLFFCQLCAHTYITVWWFRVGVVNTVKNRRHTNRERMASCQICIFGHEMWGDVERRKKNESKTYSISTIVISHCCWCWRWIELATIRLRILVRCWHIVIECTLPLWE